MKPVEKNFQASFQNSSHRLFTKSENRKYFKKYDFTFGNTHKLKVGQTWIEVKNS